MRPQNWERRKKWVIMMMMMLRLLLKMKGKERARPPLTFTFSILVAWKKVPKSHSPSPNSVVLSKDVSLSISRGVGGSTPAFLVGDFCFFPCSGLCFGIVLFVSFPKKLGKDCFC